MKMKSLHQDEVPVLEIAGRLDGAADNLAATTLRDARFERAVLLRSEQ